MTTQTTEKKNQDYFSKNLVEYRANVGRLDTYQRQRAVIDALIAGTDKLADVGNGGVFEYSTALAGSITAIDLFLDGIPRDASLPANVTPVQASVLDLQGVPGEHFDAVIMIMLLHHLTGKTASASLDNVRKALLQCAKILKPNGRLIIIESTVPRWFYWFELAVYRPAAWIIDKCIDHPATLQYPIAKLVEVAPPGCAVELVEIIPKGRWILQFGVPFPGWLTPAQPVAIVFRKTA